MDISHDEAVILVRKWKEEARVIHAGIIVGDYCLARVLGRIDEVSDKFSLSMRQSNVPLGYAYMIEFPR